MLRVLLVDDDFDILYLASSWLKHQNPEWEITTQVDPLQALDTIEKTDFDVVVSDCEMPKLSGSQLLREVATRRPLTSRIMMSSRVDLASEMEALGIAHRFVAKEDGYRELTAAIESTSTLRTRLANKELQAVMHGISSLPSPPERYFQIRSVLCREDFYQKELVTILKEDIALVTLILKAANSAYYGTRRKVTNLHDALMILGVNTINSIVLTAEVFSGLNPVKARVFKVDNLWAHASAVGNLAAELAAESFNSVELREAAYTAGLLHDIGKLVCIHSLADQYKKVLRMVREQQIPSYEAELEVFGSTHQEIGGYLLGLWGVPDQLIESVVFHHQPQLCKPRSDSVLHYVAAANVLVRSREMIIESNDRENIEIYLDSIGRTDDFSRWHEMALNAVH